MLFAFLGIRWRRSRIKDLVELMRAVAYLGAGEEIYDFLSIKLSFDIWGSFRVRELVETDKVEVEAEAELVFGEKTEKWIGFKEQIEEWIEARTLLAKFARGIIDPNSGLVVALAGACIRQEKYLHDEIIDYLAPQRLRKIVFTSRHWYTGRIRSFSLQAYQCELFLIDVWIDYANGLQHAILCNLGENGIANGYIQLIGISQTPPLKLEEKKEEKKAENKLFVNLEILVEVSQDNMCVDEYIKNAFESLVGKGASFFSFEWIALPFGPQISMNILPPRLTKDEIEKAAPAESSIRDHFQKCKMYINRWKIYPTSFSNSLPSTGQIEIVTITSMFNNKTLIYIELKVHQLD